MSNIILRCCAAELNNVGVILQSCNELDHAEELYRNAMQALNETVRDRADNREHPQLEDTCRKWHLELSRKKALIQCDEKIMSRFSCDQNEEPATLSQPLPIDINDTDAASDEGMSLIVMYNIANVNVQKQALAKAVQLLDMAVSLIPCVNEIKEGSIIAVAVTAVYHTLGELKYQHQSEDESLNMLLSALEIGRQKLGDHILVASNLNTIGQILIARGQINDAMEVFEEASRIHDCYTIETAKIGSRRESNIEAAAPAA